MIKKIQTKNHTYLIDEVKTKDNDDAYYGYSLLLSIYIAINTDKKTKTGQFYFSNNKIRVALKKDVIDICEPTQNEIEFYQLMNKEKSLTYSKSLTEKYNITKYLKYYYVNGKKM